MDENQRRKFDADVKALCERVESADPDDPRLQNDALAEMGQIFLRYRVTDDEELQKSAAALVSAALRRTLKSKKSP